jgi:hypothetical protein
MESPLKLSSSLLLVLAGVPASALAAPPESDPDAATGTADSAEEASAAGTTTSADPGAVAGDDRLDAVLERVETLEARVRELEAEKAAAEQESTTKDEALDDGGADSVEQDVVSSDLSGRADPDRPQPVTFDQWTGGNAMATRVTFAFADDNLLAGPTDRSPQPGFNLPDDELFFENLTQEKRGYETETQLVVYKRMPSYWKNFDAEAALVIELQNWINEKTFRNETVIGDDGSYLKLNWYTNKKNDYQGDNLNLTLFPMDSQRFLLGYTFDITWGGERIFPNNSGQVPGMRLKYDWNTGTNRQSYAFLGAKTARLLNDEINEPQTYYGALGGAGFGVTDWLTIEFNGGYFQRGAYPPQGVNFPGIGGRTARAFGGSTRLTFRRGMPIGSSIDFRLFKYSPDATLLLTQPQLYDDKIAFSAAIESTVVAQTLLDWEQPDTEKIQPALAGAFIGKLRIRKTRINPSFLFRNLEYVVFNIPGLAPYKAFPDGAEVRPEFFGAIRVDHYFPSPKLTPGIVLAYKRPATYTASGVTTVIRDEDDWETLPRGEGAFDILAGKLTMKWDVARFFVIVSELRYTLDKNRTKYVQLEGESGRERVFDEANVTNRLGFFMLAQARW